MNNENSTAELKDVDELRVRIESLHKRAFSKTAISVLLNRLDSIVGQRQAAHQKNKTVDAHVASHSQLEEINVKLAEIKQFLSLHAKNSISYRKIDHEAVRRSLLVDNLRMESAYLDIVLTDIERFTKFCANAVLQIEDLLNYYYYVRFDKDINSFLALLTSFGSKFKGNPTKLSQINTATKLFAFEKELCYMPGKFYESKLTLIKEVRNTGQHRCTVLAEDYDQYFADYQLLIGRMRQAKAANRHYLKSYQDKEIEKNGKLAEFIKEQSYSTVREEVRSLYQLIIQSLIALHKHPINN